MQQETVQHHQIRLSVQANKYSMTRQGRLAYGLPEVMFL